jgi:hypothetical protein
MQIGRLVVISIALSASAFVWGAPTAIPDFNGDGHADIFWRHAESGENYLYVMSGTAISAEGYLRTVADSAWRVAGVGDFDGDGRADVFWRNTSTGENYVYFMDGTSIRSEGYTRSVQEQAWFVAGIGDLDADGKDDVVWRNSSTGENYVWLMDALAIKPSEGYIRTVSDLAWHIVGVGDMDGDGRADILWRNLTNGQNYLYPMAGAQVLTTEGFIRTVEDLNWVVVGVADFNADARADILWRNINTGENYLYPMSGRNVLSSEGYLRTVADQSWHVAMTGNFDGNGTADILWRNVVSGENYIYLMDGTAISEESYIRTVADLSWEVMPSRGLLFEAPPHAAAMIGEQGGTVEVTDPQSPIFGARVDIPAGALARPTNITIGPVSASIAPPPNIVSAGPAVKFSPEGLRFSVPVSITLPLTTVDDSALIYEMANGTAAPAAAGDAEGPDQRLNAAERRIAYEAAHFSVRFPGLLAFSAVQQVEAGQSGQVVDLTWFGMQGRCGLKPRTTTETMVVHSTGSPANSSEPTFLQVLHMILMGTECTGYTYLIDERGVIVRLVDDDVQTNHVFAGNPGRIGVGLYDRAEVGGQFPQYPAEQINALVQVLKQIRTRYGIASRSNLKTHLELAHATGTCPGKYSNPDNEEDLDYDGDGDEDCADYFYIKSDPFACQPESDCWNDVVNRVFIPTVVLNVPAHPDWNNGLPSRIVLTDLYQTTPSSFQATGNSSTCGTGERGAPLFSGSVSPGALMEGARTVDGVPQPNSGPFINRRNCSSFYASHRTETSERVWINGTGRAVSGAADWEYQVRYDTGDPGANIPPRCTVGTVPNSGFYVASFEATGCTHEILRD